MSLYSQFEIERLRNGNAALLVELAEVRARAERLGSMLDLANSAMAAVNEVARKVIAERDEAINELAGARAAFDVMARVQTATATVASKAFAERDAARGEARAAEALAADSDARLVRAIDAAKAAALAALAAPGPAAAEGDEAFSLELHPRPCPLCDAVVDDDDGLDSGDGLDTARKGRTTPSVRR